MNTRMRQKIRAIGRLQTVHPIVALLLETGKPPRAILIDPRELDEAKKKYGDSLQVHLGWNSILKPKEDT